MELTYCPVWVMDSTLMFEFNFQSFYITIGYCFKNSIRDPRGFLGKFGDYQECLHVALLVVIEEKQLKEGYL